MKSPVLPFLASALFFGAALGVTLTDPSQLQTTTFDYVIVGAGNAGLVLANRLTESPGTTVLVLEAGVSDQNVIPVMAPFLGPSVTPDTPFDWNYTVVPQSGLDGRTYPYPRGRLLGGCSSANYMIHQYCTNDDWNRMAQVTGDSGWGWNNMKQYIQRHEQFQKVPIAGQNISGRFIPSLHSFTGELPVSLPVANLTIDTRVLATTQQVSEFPFNEDLSGVNDNILGIGWAQSSMTNGQRTSSSTSYLADANERPNLTVLINAMVTKLLPSGSVLGAKSFRTVQFSDGRTRSVNPSFRVQARKEVILSAGAVGTPQILQLSGIGAPADLGPLGIPILVNSPQVGRNMQDHPLLPNIFTINQDSSLDDLLRSASAIGAAIAEWETTKVGLIANNVVNNIGFARASPSAVKGLADPSSGPASPHFEVIFANFFLDPVTPIPMEGNFVTILTALVSPSSRGSVRITSTNPFVAPLIDPNMLSTEFDVTVVRESIKSVLSISKAPAWRDLINGTAEQLLSSSSDADLDAHARLHTSTIFHPSSTASMTSQTSNNGVVNPDLTVKGTDGLRIVDLSVFPFIPSCHPQGPVYLLAERAADLIKGIAR